MPEWPRVEVGSLVEDGAISYGIVQPGSETPEGVPIVRVKDLRDGVVSLESPLRVHRSVSERHSRTVLHGGELLVSLVGSVGQAAIAPPEASGWNVARAIAVLRPKGVTADWLKFCFKTQEVQAQIAASLNTTVQATLNLSDLKRIRVSFPPEDVRRRITEVLGVLDDKIAANIRTTAQVDEFLAALFERHVRGGAAEVALGDVAGVNMETVRPGEGFLRYIDISAVGQGVYEFPELSDWSDAPSRARRKVRTGDTLWSTVRPNRRAHALILSSDSRLVASTGLAVLTPLSVGSAYLYEATRRLAFARYLESVAEGSAYPAVRAERFLEAPIPMFDKAAREEFEGLASGLRKRAHLATEENRALAATRDALLPGLMSGKLRVRDAERVAEEVA